MLGTFLAGLSLGVTNAPVCLATCAPLALSVVVEPAPGRGWGSARALVVFLAGRAGGYLALGAVAGLLAQRLTFADLQRPLAFAFVVLALALWLGAVGRLAPLGTWGCSFARGPGRLARWPFLLGALTGLQACPPLLLAFGVALQGGGVAAGLAHFAGFFLGTSIGLVPFAAWPWVGRRIPEVGLARMRTSVALLVGFAFFCWGMDRLFPAEKGVTVAVTEADLRAVLPGAELFVAAQNPPRFDAFRSKEDRVPIGSCFVTSQVAPAQSLGYGGPLSALVGLDATGTIRGLRLLPHHETPVYVARVEDPAYLARYQGRKVTEPLVLGADVDAVTAATVTAGALCAGVREGGRRVAAEVFGVAPAPAAAAETAGDSWRRAAIQAPVIILICYLGVAVAVVRRWPGRRVRTAILVASIAVLGLVELQFFSIGHVVQMASGRWPPLPANLKWYVLVGGVAVITLLWGRLYCEYLCPFGALSELAARAWPWPVPLSRRVSRWLRPARYALLLATPAAYFVWRRHEVIDYEPFSPTFVALSGRGLPWDALLVGVLTLIGVLCLANRRFWCRHLCPAGTALEVVAGLRPRGTVAKRTEEWLENET